MGMPLLAKKKASTAVPGPTRFYAISYTFWDNGPAWDYHIIDVRADGADTIVRDILVISEHAPCGMTCRVRAKTKRMKNTSPASLAGDNNPCAIERRELDRENRRSKRALKHTPIFSSADFGVEATCAGNDVVLPLPLLPFPAGPQGSPQIAHAYDLLGEIEAKVFGTNKVFTSSGETKIFEDIEGEPAPAKDEIEGEALVQELRSGAFDQGLWGDCKKDDCKDAGFDHVLKIYIPPEERRRPTVSLAR